LADIPGTLSGDILRLQQNLPALNGDYEITGNQIHPLKHAPLPPDPDDDSEDLTAILTSLPVVKVDSNKHFVKKGKCKSEIWNLLKCQGGSCPGVPKSTHIIQLLGRSFDGELVFERFKSRYVLAFVHTLTVYKCWILQLISGLKCLHSLGIIHRDLRIDNLVFSSDGSRLLICDLEGRWGNRLAPEVPRQPVLDAGWTEKSDIYDLGYVIKGMIYGNVPITNMLEWSVPHPLDTIVDACTRNTPEERPSLDELYAVVDKIEVTSQVAEGI
jgi:serine/threonine protein kinase